jgi:hypothetical protein
MRHHGNRWLASLAALLALLSAPSAARAQGVTPVASATPVVASELVGSWRATIHNQHGDWSLIFTVQPTGASRPGSGSRPRTATGSG